LAGLQTVADAAGRIAWDASPISSVDPPTRI
jgi:hypothetical protein